MIGSAFTGTLTLAKLFLRRDRWLMPIIVLLPLLVSMSIASSAAEYKDIQLFVKELTSNSLISSILGPGMGASIGGVVAWRSTGQIAIILGVAMMLIVIRHTRNEEENGRSEVLRAYPTGRYASLTAILLNTFTASLLAGIFVALYFVSTGQAVVGSLLFGLTVVLIGWFHAGIGALVSQFSKGTDKVRGFAFAFAVAEIFFLIINNSQGAYTPWAWLTPMAWHRLTQPFYTDMLWPLIGIAALVALPIIAAYQLSHRRDLGEGLLPDKPGHYTAAASFKSPFALAWKLQSGLAIGLFVAVAFIGFAIGGMAQSVSQTAGIGDALSGLGGTNWVQAVGGRYAFIGIFIYILTMAVAIYAILSVLRLQKEEFDNHSEMILAKPVGRVSFMLSYVAVSLITVTTVMFVLGASAGIVFGATSGNFMQDFGTVLLMCVSKLPILWFMVGLAGFLYGILPRAAMILSFVLWALFTGIEFLWEAKIVSWSAMQLSPYAYAHYTTPVGSLALLPLVIIVVIAAGLLGGGVLWFKRRNIGQV